MDEGTLQQYAPLVWKTVYRLVANEADAADCLQETFVSAMQVSRQQEVTAWPAFLQRLATRRAIDLLRRRMSQRKHEAPERDVPSGAAGPVELAQASELREQLRQAVAQLPQQQAEVFCLRYLNDLSYGEIASELRISTDLVGVTLHRARTRLRELLGSGTESVREVTYVR